MMTALKTTGIRQPSRRVTTVFPFFPIRAVSSAARSVASEPNTMSRTLPV